MKGSITRSFSFHVNAEFQRNNQHLFWVQQNAFSTGQSFAPLYQDVNITSLHGDVAWRIGDNTELQGHIAQHNYHFRDSLTNVQEAWFLPRLELDATFQHTFKDKLRLKADLLIQTGRQGLTTDSESGTPVSFQMTSQTLGFAATLDNITMVNVHAEYLYSSRLSGWLKLNNVLNQANPFFTGYENQNLRFQMGASYAF